MRIGSQATIYAVEDGRDVAVTHLALLGVKVQEPAFWVLKWEAMYCFPSFYDIGKFFLFELWYETKEQVHILISTWTNRVMSIKYRTRSKEA